MARICPFCGAELPDPAPGQGPAPATICCPVCAQEQDHPAPPASAPSAQAPPWTGPSTLAERLGKEQAPPPPPGEGPAWEGPGGVLVRLWHTTWQVLLHPVRTLTPPGQPGHKWPLSYALILGTLGITCHLFWSAVQGGRSLPTTGVIVAMVLSPLLMLVSLYFTAAVIHFMLFIVGGAKRGFAATFRVLGYAQASSILVLVPILGIIANAVWSVVILVGGLAAVHGIGRGRAFFALMLPLLLGGLFLGLLALVMGLGFLASLMNASQSAGPFKF